MDKQAIVDFVKGFSIETTIHQGAKISDYGAILRPGTCVYIADIPGSDKNEGISLAKRLREQGLVPVPHIVARSCSGPAELEERLKRFADAARIDQVLLVGGDVPKPHGEFDRCAQLLETGLFEKYGVKKIGVAGHPEGHKDVKELELKQALIDKNAYARKSGTSLYVATQFTFTANSIFEWEKTFQPGVNSLPYRVGVPGLASFKTLLKFAMECGVGPSVRALSKNAANLSKLLLVATPDELLMELVAYKQRNPNSLLEGVHVFPFGGMKKSAEWIYAVIDGRFSINKDGKGFTVSA